MKITLPDWIPVPQNLFQITWMGMGVWLGKAFSNLDTEIRDTDFYKNSGKFTKWFLESTLNFLHHWWIGALLVLYLAQYPELYWLGWGLILDDISDVPFRLYEMYRLSKLAIKRGLQ